MIIQNSLSSVTSERDYVVAVVSLDDKKPHKPVVVTESGCL